LLNLTRLVYAAALFLGGKMEQDTTPLDVASLSFEDALAELEEIVRRLESGAAQLDEAISAYERGAALKRHCETKLHEAQLRVEKIVVGPGGSIKSEPSQLD
jgi:exodeoxyribonuclease VII small subunit